MRTATWLGITLALALGSVGCCCCSQGLCVPVQETKTVTRYDYDMKVKEVCKAPGPCDLVRHCCNKTCCDCGDVVCGKPRQVRVLRKHKVTEEECVTRCQPVACPAAKACPPMHP